MRSQIRQFREVKDYSPGTRKALHGTVRQVLAALLHPAPGSGFMALDRSVRDAERFKLEAPLERWRELRDRMHVTICKCGFDTSRKTFTQSFGSSDLDASLLLLPMVGFLPPDDPRIRGTVAAIERELVVDGLLMRYSTSLDFHGT